MSRLGGLRRNGVGAWTRFAILLILSACVLFPLVWIVSGSLNTPTAIFGGSVQWIPSALHFENYPNAWLGSGFGLGTGGNVISGGGGYSFTPSLINSIIVTAAQILIGVPLAAMAGYGFAAYRFKGKEVAFVVVLMMSLLPLQVIMVPLYLVARALGIANTYLGLILPTVASPFAVFFMRQFMTSIPREYVDAARIDGASEISIFIRIVLPLSKSALLTLGVLLGIASWDEFLWPLIVVSDDRLYTMPLAISRLRSIFETPPHFILVVTVLASLPPLIAFFLTQRRLVEGLGVVGLKG